MKTYGLAGIPLEQPRFMTLVLNRATGRIELELVCNTAPLPDVPTYVQLCKDHPDVYAVWKIDQLWP